MGVDVLEPGGWLMITLEEIDKSVSTAVSSQNALLSAQINALSGASTVTATQIHSLAPLWNTGTVQPIFSVTQPDPIFQVNGSLLDVGNVIVWIGENCPSANLKIDKTLWSAANAAFSVQISDDQEIVHFKMRWF
jgi:hypothetical protein